MTLYRLGYLRFRLAGEGPVARALGEELEPLRDLEAEERDLPDLILELMPRLGALAGARDAPPLRATDDGYQVRHSGLHYRVVREGETLRAQVETGPARRSFTWVRRFFDRDHLGPARATAREFLHVLLDQLAQVAQVRFGQSFLHASCVEHDGRAVAFVAERGIGKSAAALDFVWNSGHNYVGDDLTLVDADGYVYPSHRHVEVHDGDLAGLPELRRRLLAGRGIGDRLHWAYSSRRSAWRARRRIAPERLFGAGSDGARVQLEEVFYLEPGDGPEIEICELELDPLATRAADTVMEEIEPFGVCADALQAEGVEGVLPARSTLRRITREILAAAMSRARLRLVRLPAGARVKPSFIRAAAPAWEGLA